MALAQGAPRPLPCLTILNNINKGFEFRERRCSFRNIRNIVDIELSEKRSDLRVIGRRDKLEIVEGSKNHFNESKYTLIAISKS